MDYPCAKFGDFSFNRFGFNARKKQTKSQTDADERYTHATLVGVSTVTRAPQDGFNTSTRKFIC